MRDFEMDTHPSQAHHHVFTHEGEAEHFCNEGEVCGRAMPSAHRDRPSTIFSRRRADAECFCTEGEICGRAMPSAFSFTRTIIHSLYRAAI